MTSLKSRVKFGFMKKLFLYVFLVLMWFNVVVAEKISLIDIKIGDKISKYFNSQQLSKYYVSNADPSPSGEKLFGKDLKYSFIAMTSEDKIFEGDYAFYQIYYENNSKKIVSLSGIDISPDVDSCLKKRSEKVSEYKSKNRITSLFNKQESEDTFLDGVKTYNVGFYGPRKIFAFSCYVYPDDNVEYSFTIYENEYNSYIYKKMNE